MACQNIRKCNYWPCIGCKYPDFGYLCCCDHCQVWKWLSYIDPEEAIKRLWYPETHESPSNPRYRKPDNPPPPQTPPPRRIKGRGMNPVTLGTVMILALLLVTTRVETTMSGQVKPPSPLFKKLEKASFLYVGRIHVENSVNTIHLKILFSDLLNAGDELEEQWMNATKSQGHKFPLKTTIDDAICTLQLKISQLRFEFSSRVADLHITKQEVEELQSGIDSSHDNINKLFNLTSNRIKRET